MPSPSLIVGRSPADDDPIVRDGEIVRGPLLLRDGFTVNAGGGLMMTDGTDLAHRLRFASPQVRAALGLPPQHLEDGKGNIAGHAPGYVLGSDQLGPPPRRTSEAVRRQAFENYQHWLTSAWKTP